MVVGLHGFFILFGGASEIRAVKAIGSMGDLNHQLSIDLSSYSQDVAPANANDQ